MRQYISDIIDKETASSWEKGQNIGIDAQTGAGKTYWILNVLYSVAKEKGERILIFESRANARDKFKTEVALAGKDDVIDVVTYQKTDFMIDHRTIDYKLNNYGYLCFDDVQYVYEDSSFNDKTEITYDDVFDSENHVKIYLSATGDYVFEDMQQKDKDMTIYYLDRTWDNLQCIMSFSNAEYVKKLLKSIPKDEKCIVFCRSAMVAKELSEEFGGVFNCSKSNYKYTVDTALINGIFTREKFDCQFFFTTTACDNGVNLRDPALKHIICIGLTDPNQIIQCIGRKRTIDENDKATVYIQEPSKKQIAAHARILKQELIVVNTYEEQEEKSEAVMIYYHGSEWYKNKYFTKDETAPLGHRVKETRVKATLSKIRMYEEMNKVSSMTYLLNLMRYKGHYHNTDNDDLVAYLKELYENKVVFLTKEDRLPLLQKIDYWDNNHGKYVQTDRKLNEYLRNKNIPFQIKKFKTKRRHNGEYKKYESAWKIIPL